MQDCHRVCLLTLGHYVVSAHATTACFNYLVASLTSSVNLKKSLFVLGLESLVDALVIKELARGSFSGGLVDLAMTHQH